MSRSQATRRALVALTIATACTAGALVRGADRDVSPLQRPASPELSAEAGRVDRLEALTQGVEALSAIKRLQHAYGHYSELGLWHDFADPGWTATNQTAPFHFDASRVGQPILAVPEPARSSEQPTLAALAKRMADLAARAQRLSDEIEVTNLQHAYGYYVDRTMWDDVADLSSATARWRLGCRGSTQDARASGAG